MANKSWLAQWMPDFLTSTRTAPSDGLGSINTAQPTDSIPSSIPTIDTKGSATISNADLLGNRGSVDYIGGVYKGADGKFYNKEAFTADTLATQDDILNASEGSETDWGMSGWGGVGLGLGNLALGAWGASENAKTAGLQRDVLKQQRDANEIELAMMQQKEAEKRKAFGLEPATYKKAQRVT